MFWGLLVIFWGCVGAMLGYVWLFFVIYKSSTIYNISKVPDFALSSPLDHATIEFLALATFISKMTVPGHRFIC